MTPCSIEDERLRQAFPTSPGRTEPSESCSADDLIWDAARGDLDTERTQKILEHAAGCASCQMSLRAAREIAAASGERDLSVALPARAGRRRRTWVGVGIAAAAAVVAFVLLTPFGPKAPGSHFRDTGSSRIESLVDERQPLPRDAFVLQWKVASPGEIYTVEVALEDLTVIDRAEEIETGEYRVPPSALEGLDSGTTLLWRVEALLRDTTRVSSPVFRAVLE